MVPKVTDTRYEEAIRLLKHLALSPGKISYRETQDRNLEGRVADQHPAPGVSVKAGTAVHLTVHQYRHPEQSGRKAVVPDLLGKKIPQAEIMIRESGLVLGEIVLKTTRLRQEAGRIFQQNPPHGTRVTPGTRVDIWAHEYFGQPSTLQIRP
jgi:beta-lactam-binding protein with PASTA domain